MNHEMYANGHYLQNNPTWHVEDSPWKAKQILRMLEKNNIQPRTVAEVGCGAGEILAQLCLQMPQNTHFTGYELSPDAFSMCKSRSNDRLTFRMEDPLNKGERTDLLLVIDVFEHVEDYISFIKKCQPIAKYKMFHIPLDISVQSVLRGTIMAGRRKFGHLHYFTKETALATLEDYGYRIVDHFYTAGSLELARTIKAKIAYLPRLILDKIDKDFSVKLLGGHSLLVVAE
jgi:2-polyprenyl-3-methyl-5-hydroxy-6-metoxy-1,4-benzoquinol methylase